MIIDNLKNINRYKDLFPEVIAFINNNNLTDIKTGKHTISENCFALVNEYNTKNDSSFIAENHREYIDFQLLVKGCELMRFADMKTLELTQTYDEENDYEIYTGTGDSLIFKEPQFVVFFPGEAHQPGLACNNVETFVRKIVFKIHK